MMRIIVMVSCVSEKRTIASSAEVMYISDWFLKAATHASAISRIMDLL